MKQLENKTYDSKRDMEIMDALNEVKEINKRKKNIDNDKLVDMINKADLEKE